MSGYAFYTEKRTEAIVLEKTAFALGKKTVSVNWHSCPLQNTKQNNVFKKNVSQ